MPEARNDNEKNKILPQPVTEDGLVEQDRKDRSHPEDEIDDRDGGLTDIGGGDPNERKII